MAGLKRTDNKGRILKDGESQRKDGSYRYRYTDADGIRHDVYSKRLVPTDRVPPGCKDDLKITVDAACCAGVTPESHAAALKTMQMCQVNVENWEG